MNLRVRALGLDFWVDVRQRRPGSRWVAVADLANEKDLCLGMSARAAVLDALAPLGQHAVTALTADHSLATVDRADAP